MKKGGYVTNEDGVVLGQLSPNRSLQDPYGKFFVDPSSPLGRQLAEIPNKVWVREIGQLGRFRISRATLRKLEAMCWVKVPLLGIARRLPRPAHGCIRGSYFACNCGWCESSLKSKDDVSKCQACYRTGCINCLTPIDLLCGSCDDEMRGIV